MLLVSLRLVLSSGNQLTLVILSSVGIERDNALNSAKGPVPT